jgi:hypothetical protein
VVGYNLYFSDLILQKGSDAKGVFGWCHQVKCNGMIPYLDLIPVFSWKIERNEVVSKENILSRSRTHSFLKVGGISLFLYAKATHTHLTPLFSHNFILLDAPHVCSHLLFLEIVTFHSLTEHKNGTNPFHVLAQTEHKNETNPFFRNGTMTLHSTWFSNRTHPKI